MTAQSKAFWAGFAVYLVSFVVTAVDGAAVRSGPALGYHCAFYSLLFGAGEAVSLLRGNATIFGPAEILALLASGVTNVVFAAAVVLALVGRSRRAEGVIVKYLVILMFPFSWVVLYHERLYPVLGYFLWAVGMALVLFTNKSTLAKIQPLRGP